MEKEKLERISHLSRKERTIGLDEEEEKRTNGSKEGISGRNPKKLGGHVENTYVVNEKGNKRKIHRRF